MKKLSCFKNSKALFCVAFSFFVFVNVSFAAEDTVGVGLSVLGSVVNPPTISVTTFANQTARFSGATYPGASVIVELNNDAGFKLFATVTPNALGVWVYDTAVLAPGNYNVDAYAEFMGVASAKTDKEYFVVTEYVAPIIPTVTEIFILGNGMIFGSNDNVDINRANVDLSVFGQYVILEGTNFSEGDAKIIIDNNSVNEKNIKISVGADGRFFYTVNNLALGEHEIIISSSLGQVRRGNFFITDESSKGLLPVEKEKDQGGIVEIKKTESTPGGNTTEEIKVFMPGEIKKVELKPVAQKLLTGLIKKYLTRENLLLFLYTVAPFFFFFAIFFAKRRKKEEEKKKNQ